MATEAQLKSMAKAREAKQRKNKQVSTRPDTVDKAFRKIKAAVVNMPEPKLKPLSRKGKGKSKPANPKDIERMVHRLPSPLFMTLVSASIQIAVERRIAAIFEE